MYDPGFMGLAIIEGGFLNQLVAQANGTLALVCAAGV